MAKAKRSAARALEWLAVEGVEVVAVVAGEPDEYTRDEQRVDLVAEHHGLPLASDEELYASPPGDVDRDLGLFGSGSASRSCRSGGSAA